MILQLLMIDSLDQPQLNYTSVEGIQIVQDGVDLDFSEEGALFLNNLLEVLEESLSCAETGIILTSVSSGLKVQNIQTVDSQVISESLHRLLRVPLDAFKISSLVLVVELLNAPFKLDLSCPEWMDLLELLEVEESLRY